MNKRIKELAYEAKLDEHMLWTSDVGNKLPDNMIKFAELIVQECLSYLRDRHAQALKQNWKADEALNAVEGDIVRGFQINEF